MFHTHIESVKSVIIKNAILKVYLKILTYNGIS